MQNIVPYGCDIEGLGAERMLQRLRGVRGQDDATETGRRVAPQTIVIVLTKYLKLDRQLVMRLAVC